MNDVICLFRDMNRRKCGWEWRFGDWKGLKSRVESVEMRLKRVVWWLRMVVWKLVRRVCHVFMAVFICECWGLRGLNGKGAWGERVLVGGLWVELFCFSVVGRGGKASVWGLMGGNVILFGVFLAFFLAYREECRTFEAVFERI